MVDEMKQIIYHLINHHLKTGDDHEEEGRGDEIKNSRRENQKWNDQESWNSSEIVDDAMVDDIFIKFHDLYWLGWSDEEECRTGGFHHHTSERDVRWEIRWWDV